MASAVERPGHFDHGAHPVWDLDLITLHDLLRGGTGHRPLVLQLGDVSHQGNHDLGVRFLPSPPGEEPHDGLGLHSRDFRKNDPQTAAPVSQHGIDFIETVGLDRRSTGTPHVVGRFSMSFSSWGRNSCSGGSTSGRSPASPASPGKCLWMPPFAWEAALAKARFLPSRSSAQDHFPNGMDAIAFKNMCSVRVRPMPGPRKPGPFPPGWADRRWSDSQDDIHRPSPGAPCNPDRPGNRRRAFPPG